MTGDDEVPGDAPPPYDESWPTSASTTEKQPVASTPDTTLSGMHKFPEALNLYAPWTPSATWNGIWHLGPSQKERLFTFATGKPLAHECPALYEGSDTNGPVIGTVQVRYDRPVADILIVVQPHPGSPLQQPLTLTVGGAYDLKHPFDAPVGQNGQPERFEWRKTRGEEVKKLKADSTGWKLVWTGTPATSTGDLRGGRGEGVTSDGFEVVAVAAWNALQVKSLRKTMKFLFVGKGATGVFGETWEAIAVLSFLQLYELDVANTVNASHLGRDPLKKGQPVGSKP